MEVFIIYDKTIFILSLIKEIKTEIEIIQTN